MERNAQRIPRVLLVDDDEMFFVALEHYSRQFGILLDFLYAPDMGKGIDRLNESCCDAVVLDVFLPGVTGITMGEMVRKHDPLVPMAYLTNLDSDKIREQARLQGAVFLFKQQFIFGDDGFIRLLQIIEQLARLNPCLEGGIRIDSQGFPRKLPETPIEIPEPFALLLHHSRAMVRAA